MQQHKRSAPAQRSRGRLHKWPVRRYPTLSPPREVPTESHEVQATTVVDSVPPEPLEETDGGADTAVALRSHDLPREQPGGAGDTVLGEDLLSPAQRVPVSGAAPPFQRQKCYIPPSSPQTPAPAPCCPAALTNLRVYAVNLFGIATFVFDLVTDIALMVSYYRSGDHNWFALTLAFIILPSLVISLTSMKWYVTDYRWERRHLLAQVPPIDTSNEGGTRFGPSGRQALTSLGVWVLRWVFTILQLGLVVRYIEVLYHACKEQAKARFSPHVHKTASARNRNHGDHRRPKDGSALQRTFSLTDHVVLKTLEEVDAALLRLFECFLESAPQLVLQLYIIFTNGMESGHWRLPMQLGSIAVSQISLAYGIVAYHRCLRLSVEGKEKLDSFVAMATMFLWRLFTISSRVLALALFVSLFHRILFYVLAAHWLLMLALLFLFQTLCRRAGYQTFCERQCEQTFFNLVAAAIHIFCYFNIFEGHTRYRYIAYYCVTYAENVVLVTLWYTHTPAPYPWYRLPGLVYVCAAFWLGIVFMCFYYHHLHPNRDNCWFRSARRRRMRDVDALDSPAGSEEMNGYRTEEEEGGGGGGDGNMAGNGRMEKKATKETNGGLPDSNPVPAVILPQATPIFETSF